MYKDFIILSQHCKVKLRPSLRIFLLQMRIISIDVFLKTHFLVIHLPLTKTVLYNFYHVLPFQREKILNLHSRNQNMVIY